MCTCCPGSSSRSSLVSLAADPHAARRGGSAAAVPGGWWNGSAGAYESVQGHWAARREEGAQVERGAVAAHRAQRTAKPMQKWMEDGEIAPGGRWPEDDDESGPSHKQVESVLVNCAIRSWPSTCRYLTAFQPHAAGIFCVVLRAETKRSCAAGPHGPSPRRSPGVPRRSHRRSPPGRLGWARSA